MHSWLAESSVILVEVIVICFIIFLVLVITKLKLKNLKTKLQPVLMH